MHELKRLDARPFCQTTAIRDSDPHKHKTHEKLLVVKISGSTMGKRKSIAIQWEGKQSSKKNDRRPQNQALYRRNSPPGLNTKRSGDDSDAPGTAKLQCIKVPPTPRHSSHPGSPSPNSVAMLLPRTSFFR